VKAGYMEVCEDGLGAGYLKFLEYYRCNGYNAK